MEQRIFHVGSGVCVSRHYRRFNSRTFKVQEEKHPLSFLEGIWHGIEAGDPKLLTGTNDRPPPFWKSAQGAGFDSPAKLDVSTVAAFAC